MLKRVVDLFISVEIGYNNNTKNLNGKQQLAGKEKWVSYFYRTATTFYPCCVPALGELKGAGRKRLTHGKYRAFSVFNE